MTGYVRKFEGNTMIFRIPVVWELCGGGEVVGMCWVKIRQKCDYIICEFALFNNILWCPKICANEASSGQN